MSDPRRRATDKGWKSWRGPIRDVWLLVVTVLVLVSVNAASDAGKDNRRAITQIQVERKRNTLDSCARGNDQNAAIRGFIFASVPKDREGDPRVAAYLELARKTFPENDCAAEVRQRVKDVTP